MTEKNSWVAPTKTDFIKALKNNAADVELTNDQAKSLYDTFIKIMKDTIRSEEKLVLNGFGTFKVRKLAPRKGINPRTKEPLDIPSSKTVGFKPTALFKKEL